MTIPMWRQQAVVDKCYCAKSSRPCSYHDGYQDGYDDALASAGLWSTAGRGKR